jgi:uncharacterized membrane protein
MKTRLTEKNVIRGRAQAVHPSLKSGEGIKTERSITINRSPEEIYSFWHQLNNLPRFMHHVESVTPRDAGISHWVVKTSHGRTLEWDARVIEDKPGHMISWQSLEGADMDNAGSVWFTPAADGNGTVVKISMKYSPPGGKIGVAISKFLGNDPGKEMEADLSRLKEILEHSEISGAM